MTFFFDPGKKTMTPLTGATLTMDKDFIIGVSSDDKTFGGFSMWFQGGTGNAEEVSSSGNFRKFRIVPRLPGLQTLIAASSPAATDGGRLRVEVVKPKKVEEDMVYTGQKLIWFNNLPKDVDVIEFSATSGLSIKDDSWQQASEMRLTDHGPIPEGIYTFWARRDPNRQASIVNEKGDLDGRQGIQILPHGGVTPSHKKHFKFPGWGTHRVRLNAHGWNAAPSRGGFYLHDSHKGYTHGCVEVPKLFPILLKYAEAHQKPEWLKVRVSYSSDAATTLGNTLTPEVTGEYDKPADD